MKKQYEFPVHVVESNDRCDFELMLERKIKTLYGCGFYVEVQYSAHKIGSPDSCTRYTAILLPYKEE